MAADSLEYVDSVAATGGLQSQQVMIDNTIVLNNIVITVNIN